MVWYYIIMVLEPHLHLDKTIILLESESKPRSFIEVKCEHNVPVEVVEFDPDAEGDIDEVGRRGVEEGGAGRCKIA